MVVTSAYIQLTNAGGADATYFDLFSDIDGLTGPSFEEYIPKALLLAGYTSYLVPVGTTIIRVRTSTKLTPCNIYVDLPVGLTTSTTTTTTTPSPVFVSTWRTTALNETVTLPFDGSGNYNCIVDWGDASPRTNIDNTNYNTDNTHTYTRPGDYVLSLIHI